MNLGLFSSPHPNYIPPKQQPKPIPPSKLMPRGYRKPRQPKEIPPVEVSENFNFPTLNEMMAFCPKPVPTESQKVHDTHKMIENYKNHHKEILDDFLQGLTHTPSELPMPACPNVEQSTVFIPHYDQPAFIDGVYFSIQETGAPVDQFSDQDNFQDL